MTTPDIINGVFELLGSVAVWLNVLAVIKDKGYAGTRVPMMLFFAGWGYWNLYFYHHLLQWFSYASSMSLTLANTAALTVMFIYGRKK